MYYNGIVGSICNMYIIGSDKAKNVQEMRFILNDDGKVDCWNLLASFLKMMKKGGTCLCREIGI